MMVNITDHDRYLVGMERDKHKRNEPKRFVPDLSSKFSKPEAVFGCGSLPSSLYC
jgi:hypothetical protein